LKPSDYATVNVSRNRPALLVGVGCVLMFALVAAVAASKPGDDTKATSGDSSERPWYDERLRAFFAAKEKQARQLDDGQTAPGDAWRYFDAGIAGDWRATSNMWVSMRGRAHQYGGKTPDYSLDKVWAPILETELARQQFANGKEKYVLAYGNDIIKSIPAGSIYFGGTDPGRGVITAMSESQIDGNPCFTITQNALADNTYLDYLRAMYGHKIYICSQKDLSDSFSEYMQDVMRRYQHDSDPQLKDEPRQLKPGESPTTTTDGHVTVSGQVSVMAINGLLAKIIFDWNSTNEFYVEESFPLDWMYPHLSPNGLIMKINRQPLAGLSAETVQQDHEYWFKYLQPLIGDWLHEGTPVVEVTTFAEKVYLNHDLGGFTGDREFLEDTWAQKSYSKLRSSIAGLYQWRGLHAADSAGEQRMTREADFAYRQAFALCPTSPEVLHGYVELLLKANRVDDATLLIETSLKLDSTNTALQTLLHQVKNYKRKP
jgi:hypothetical protein